jgi:hypothetical protein
MNLTKAQITLRALLRTFTTSQCAITDRERESLFIAVARALSPRIDAAMRAQEAAQTLRPETPAQFARSSGEIERRVLQSINGM